MLRGKEAESGVSNSWTVIFLLDDNPPTKVVLLKRAPWKKFAPNFYTGIGGTIENETALANAHRELGEETGVSVPELIEFARCVILGENKVVYYFWAVYVNPDLPDCNEGVLEWVGVDLLLQKKIIPTTRMIIEEWQRREFALDRSWTLFARPSGDQLFERELERIEDGLVG